MIQNERPVDRAGGTVQTALDGGPRPTPTLLDPDGIGTPTRTPAEAAARSLCRVAFYGTLMSNNDFTREAGVRGVGGRSLGPAKFRGVMYSTGGFPAVVEGDGVVEAELWECEPEHLEHALRVLDGIEGYREDDPERSMYLRKRVELLEPAGEVAWVYIWNRRTEGLVHVPHGAWQRFWRTVGADWFRR
jgi:gamma-glutamylcyclotransferase (GGCT)/AIG2-like uncharacterized protein YtfP